MSLKSRFENANDLVDALCNQRIVLGNRELATALATTGELMEFPAGKNIIEQGATDQDIYFILAGRGQVIINGVRLYPRAAGVTVGEMSAVNRAIKRAATIEAIEETIALKLSHSGFHEVADEHPVIWKPLAEDLAGRLEQRNQFINRTNLKPSVFVISSAEALPIARAVRVGISHNADVDLWSDDEIFAPGGYPIEALDHQVNMADFGIALAEPDDVVLSRDRKSLTPRDNVIFELGFFMSRLGRARTILLVPSSEEIKLPSDFKGLTPITYKRPTETSDIARTMGPTIDRIIAHIGRLGVRASLVEAR